MNNVIDNIKKELFEIIVKSDVEDQNRDIPLYRDIFHVIGSIRCAVLIAKKRGIDCSTSEIAMALHDVSRLNDGKLKDHALNSSKKAGEILRIQGVASAEINEIVTSIKLHVDKSEVNSELDELVKDADLLDGYLNGDEFINPELINRIDKIKKEFSI